MPIEAHDRGGFCIIGANAVVKKIDSDSTLF